MKKLTGTEKQIAWADKIRSQKVAHLDSVIARTAAEAAGESAYNHNGMLLDFSGHSVEQRAAEAAKLERLLRIRDLIIAKTEARFWIDNRDRNFVTDRNLHRELCLPA